VARRNTEGKWTVGGLFRLFRAKLAGDEKYKEKKKGPGESRPDGKKKSRARGDGSCFEGEKRPKSWVLRGKKSRCGIRSFVPSREKTQGG